MKKEETFFKENKKDNKGIKNEKCNNKEKKTTWKEIEREKEKRKKNRREKKRAQSGTHHSQKAVSTLSGASIAATCNIRRQRKREHNAYWVFLN